MSGRGNRIAARIGGVVALSATLAAATACTTQAKTAAEAPPPKVAVAVAEQRDVALETGYTGRIDAVDSVELRPRVSGALEQVLFREGSLVARGTPLFRIDQRPYVIALRRAEAEVATIEAQLARARDEFARADRLVAADAISIEEAERRRAEVATLEARLAAARAHAQDAALDVEFTTVQAPVSGRVGRAEVTPGNLVNGTAGSATRLAMLQSTDPVYAYFELDPATAAAAARQPRAGWRAEVSTFDGGTKAAGPIDFVDNGVGAATGTLKVRARLANPGGRLMPGAAVKVAFRYGTATRSIVVPEIAIGTDQGARHVLVAGRDGIVEYRPVALGPKVGDWRVVTDAVQAGDRIVLPGMPGLRPGIKVEPVEEVRR